MALVLLGGLLTLLVLADNFNFLFTFASPVALQFFFALSSLIILCSFQARRAQTRQFATGAALATVFVFFYTGFYYVDGAPDEIWTRGNRTGIRRAYNYFLDERRNCQDDIAGLEAGLRVFGKTSDSVAIVPTRFRGEGERGYVVPAVYAGKHSWDAFPLGTPYTVSTAVEARARWQADGPRWIARAKQVVAVSRNYEAPLSTALEQQGFAKTAWWYAMVTAGFGAWIVALDYLFARMGRANFTKRRAPRVKRA